MLWIPLLTLVIPVIALVSGARRRRPNQEGMPVDEFGWGSMIMVWLILLALMYLVYIPFVAPLRDRRRRESLDR